MRYNVWYGVLVASCFDMFFMKISIKILQSIVIFIFFATKAYADVSSYYTSIQQNPAALYDFFKKMPKGGELHYHFQGSAYPAELIHLLKKHSYCLNPLDYQVTEYSRDCNHFNTKDILAKKHYYNNAVQQWSMHNLVADKKQRF